jgi:putative hydrolase of the HAD superfamily
MARIRALFLDIGGVLLTNGWDRGARKRAAETFHLDPEEMGERHHLTFDTYESGKLSLDEYLERVVFYENRPFTLEQFRDFMFVQSQPFPEMIDLFRAIKARHHVKLVTVSNEGRELTEYRIRKFNLVPLIDAFISSCFIHFRKPDLDIFRTALDVTQIPAEEVAYVDDRLMFIQVAASLGLVGVYHTSYESTRDRLAALGLKVEINAGDRTLDKAA